MAKWRDLEEIVNNSDNDDSSQSYDGDMSSENKSRPISFQSEEMIALIIKRQKVIFNAGSGQKQGQSLYIISSMISNRKKL